MKYKNWTPKQLSNALSINQEIKMPINGISINSKLINKGNLFIPLKGKKNDGHSFIEESFKKGANLSLVNNCPSLKK